MLDFNAAQVHLAVNHLPVFAVLLAGVTLAFAAVTRRAEARNLGLGILVFAAGSALPAQLSGEGAEEIVEDRPGVSEAVIERHEEAAERAFAVTLAAGIAAAAALVALRLRRQPAARLLSALALVGALVATGAMLQAAHLGGQIRHDEIRLAAGDTTRLRRGRERIDRQKVDDD